ncbi:MAG: chorismate synthase [Chloroflexota bacterium]
MKLRFLTAGESHGPALTAILDGMPARLELDGAVIDRELARRQQGVGAGRRMKLEQDRVVILGGVLAGMTTGAPLAMLIRNNDHEKWRGKAIPAFTAPRPGHADLTGAVKYGYNDLRPALERASARETAARVAVGAVCKHMLAQFGIRVGGYISEIGEVAVDLEQMPLEERIELARQSPVGCPDSERGQAMQEHIQQAMQARDTLGGVIEVVALGLPPGLGSYVQWDQRLEARLGAALLSVQAIKGVEIGRAFENARRLGTQAHDAIRIQGDALVRSSNRAGGVEGGITNGEPILVRAAMKPIATTLSPQLTVDLASGEEAPTRYERSDFCPVPRAVPILEAMVSFVLADALLEKLGGDSMDELQERFKQLRKLQLSQLLMEGGEHVFWPGDVELP